MTQKSRQCFSATVRNGEPRSRRYYETVIARVIANCKPGDDIGELCPFCDEDSSSLAYALWRLAVDEYVTGRHIEPQPIRKGSDYDYCAIDSWMIKQGFTNRKLAALLKVHPGTIDRVRAGYYSGRPMIERIMRLMNAANNH